MSDILAKILARKREEITERSARVPLAELAQRARTQGKARGFERSLRAKLGAGKPAVIAEVKKASPSKGVIRKHYDPIAIAQSYQGGGATCLSVLTDVDFFQGSNLYLGEARNACSLPVLRKDFTIDPYQVYEARVIGADAILLIVAALDDATLARLHAVAAERGFAVLVEVHTGEELTRAQQVGARLIGVNSRNLKTLAVSLDTAVALAARLGPGVVGVAESGIRTRADIDALTAAGYHAFLVGERFMTQPDPGAALRELTAVPA